MTFNVMRIINKIRFHKTTTKCCMNEKLCRETQSLGEKAARRVMSERKILYRTAI